MKPNEIAEAARAKIAGNPQVEDAMRAEWSKVMAAISAHVATSKKKWKVYEAHHVTATARLEMLTAFVAGKTPAECAAAALGCVGIPA